MTYIVCGILADSVALLGKYKNSLLNSLSFLIFSLTTSGPIIFMWLTPVAYREALLARGKSLAYVNKVMLASDWKTVFNFFSLLLGSALIGILLGHCFSKKAESIEK